MCKTCSTKTLEEINIEYVQPWTKIINDYLKAYNTKRLQDFGYIDEIVNHSKHFKHLISGAHTNTIEGTRSAVMCFILGYKIVKTRSDGYFVEYIWRKRFARSTEITFYALVEHILEYHHINGGFA